MPHTHAVPVTYYVYCMKLTTSPVPPKGATRISFTREHERVEFVREGGETTLILGIGKEWKPTLRTYRTLVRRIVSAARGYRCATITLTWSDIEVLGVDAPRVELLRTFAENAVMANYEFISFKKPPAEGWSAVSECAFMGEFSLEDKRALAMGGIIGEEVNATRELANMPGGDMTPATLAAYAKRAGEKAGVKVTVLGKKEMEKLGMGAILGVGKGSVQEPKFISVEYLKGGKRAPIVLVGKGVTFDTGGINLKPSAHILDMNLDMSGGAAVLHSVLAAARLKLKVNVVGLVPAVENMPSGESYRPGDILKSLSGKTIEVLDTDAEGRVILADALTYAARYKPQKVVDVATLTGASLVALGTKASALMTFDDGFADELERLGEESGEYLWRFPLWDEYKELVKGRFGDVPNIPTENSRYAGVIGGGMFLAQFIEGYPEGCVWAHIDMAPRMTADKSDCLAPGAAGSPVRLLVRLLEASESR